MKKICDYKPIILGIDHGYGNIKTAHRIFLSGVDRLAGEAIASSSVLEYQGGSYIIGESHLTFQGEKTEDQRFYLLTLAAIAEELNYRGMDKANLILAAGLPLAWTGSQKKDFRSYLMRDADPAFIYRGKEYQVHVGRVLVFPQGIADAYNLGSLPGDNMIVDIGNGTMNIAMIVDGMPMEKSLATENYGVSVCVREIRGAISKRLGRNVEERVVERLVRNGCGSRTDETAGIARQVTEEYAEEIIRRLMVYGYSPDEMKLYVFGGGGCLLKNYSTLVRKENVVFVDDICANAKGYEYLARMKLGGEI